MLSRTADHLYWISRYMERAENIARFLEVANNLALSGGNPEQVWQPVLTIADGTQTDDAVRSDLDTQGVIRWSVLDLTNPSSIICCLKYARENAHAVRSVIPNEMWEVINATWLEARTLNWDKLMHRGLIVFCDWVKERTNLFRGVSMGSMIRDEIYSFLRLGTYMERADNAARLLSVRGEAVTAKSIESEAAEQLHWAAVLKSVGALKAYRLHHKGDISPVGAVQMLILNDTVPRSLHYCMNLVSDILTDLAHDYECTRMAGSVHASLHFGLLTELLDPDLDTFVAKFLRDNNALALQVSKDFLMTG
jgi:uncharacterized alpha-E superfamily protein